MERKKSKLKKTGPMKSQNHEEMRIKFRDDRDSSREYIWDCECINTTERPQNGALYEITSNEIETCDATRIINDLRPDPDNPYVKGGPGKLMLLLEIDRKNPCGNLSKPEFKEFIQKAEKNGVCWIYLAAPKNSLLQMILAASGSNSHIKAVSSHAIELTTVPSDVYVFFCKSNQSILQTMQYGRHKPRSRQLTSQRVDRTAVSHA